MRSAPRALVHLYWGDLDKIGHVHGCDSWQWGDELESDRPRARPARRPAARRLLAHRHRRPRHGRLARTSCASTSPTSPLLAAGVRHVTAEARAPQLYVEPGAARRRARRRGRELLGDRGDRAAAREEAVAAGWFGAGRRPSNLPRIGDVVVAMRGRFAVVDSRRARPELLAPARPARLAQRRRGGRAGRARAAGPHRLGCRVVADLVFFSGTMDCGKSTLALQMDHNNAVRGRQGLIFTKLDRMGESVLSSRLGLSTAAIEVDDDLDFWDDVVERLTSRRPGRLPHLRRGAVLHARRRSSSSPGSSTSSASTCTPSASPPTSAPSSSRARAGSSSSPTGCSCSRSRRCAGAAARPPTTPASSTASWSSRASRWSSATPPRASTGLVEYEVLCRRHYMRRMNSQAARAAVAVAGHPALRPRRLPGAAAGVAADGDGPR